jgi:RepB DNA-primase from phage plasmid
MPQPRTQTPTATATDFLTRSFAPRETIALLLRREVPSATLQRIVELETALAPRYLDWLSDENSAGANVYVAANPLRSGATRRTKECIAWVRHLYLDLDTEGEGRLASLRASDTVPAPTAILSTSLGKYQVLWRVEGFTVEQQESALKLLALAFGGDPACTDCNRVLRLPGFLNCKYDPTYPITVEYPGDFTWHCDDFRLDLLAADAMLSPSAMPLWKHSSKHAKKYTNSEHDWAWVLHELASGKDAAKLTRTLASRRADKPNPLYYAQRTVDVASARLWLIEGVPINDVVTILEVRRRFEIPAALCSARAWEIAQTAQRMITRRRMRDLLSKKESQYATA